jgi:hypothetical protein
VALYYSASIDGFCDERVYGTKMVAIADSKAVDQAVLAAAALDAADFEEAQKAAFHAGEDIASVDPLAFVSRVTAVYNDPPMMMVGNPDCKLPDDAFPISDEQYQALRAELDAGKVLVMGKSGLSAEVPTRSLDDVLQIVRSRRDRMLAKSDWTQTSDNPLSAAKKALWKDFRDTLRNLPRQIEMMKAAELVKLTSGATKIDEVFPSPPA